MIFKALLTFSMAFCSLYSAECKAQDMSFDLTKPQPVYDVETGWGYDIVAKPEGKLNKPFYFSVKVPDGNYRVTVVLGSKKKAGETTVRAENRRMMVEKCVTKKGQTKEYSFVVNKRDINIPSYTDEKGKVVPADKVKLHPREDSSLSWDEKLTLEFNGASPCVKSIRIERDTTATTVFLCGNSTVVDQAMEPWTSWGQMFTRWFVPSPNTQHPTSNTQHPTSNTQHPTPNPQHPTSNTQHPTPNTSIANYAESGLTATSFMAQNRLKKILTLIKPGDYVICEFGHNDEKEKGPGTGAWYHYTVMLKKYIDMIREKQGNVILCTPTQRRFFNEDGTIKNTHGDFPAAMKAVAERENVPLIDLNAETKTLFEAMGVEGSKHLLVHYPMGSFAWQEKAFADNTHFNPFGAYEVAKLVVMGLKKINSPLVNSLSSEWVDFSPSRPDDWQTFYWPESVMHDSTKPLGN